LKPFVVVQLRILPGRFNTLSYTSRLERKINMYTNTMLISIWVYWLHEKIEKRNIHGRPVADYFQVCVLKSVGISQNAIFIFFTPVTIKVLLHQLLLKIPVFKYVDVIRAWTNVRTLESSRTMIEIGTRIIALPKFGWFANFVFISNNSTLNKISHENNVNLPK